MKNFVQEGNTVTFTAAAALSGGAGVLLSATLFGVNSYDVVVGAPGEAAINGVFTLPKAAITNAQFAAAYWDSTGKQTTNVASGNVLIGFYTEAGGVSVSSPVCLIPKAA